MIKDTVFVVVDTETTGATPTLDKIVEIGAVKILNGNVIETYQTLLNPERLMPHNVFQIHGISDDMVRTAPRFEDIVEGFLNFIGEETIFAAHNAEFDKEFINAELSRIGRDRLPHQTLCTLKLAKRVFPDFKKYNLGSLAETLNIPLENAHRALDDSLTTAQVLIKMFEALESNGKQRLQDINLKSPVKSPILELF